MPKFLRVFYLHFENEGGDDKSPFGQMADIYLGFFFFAGRSCEFCLATGDRKTSRVAIEDVEFRDEGRRVVEVGPETDLESLKFVTITFRDQKNQGRTKDPILDPVMRLASAVIRIKRKVKDWNQKTELCTTGDTSNRLRTTSELTLKTIRMVCRARGGKQEFGFAPEEIGNKSLRSGAAMALALSKQRYSELHIMFLGRWKSNAFWDYIRPQVIELTSDMAPNMVDHKATDLAQEGTNQEPNEGTEWRLDF